MAEIRTLDGLEVAGRRVLVRADLNVPVADGTVTDTTRIDRFAPTVVELADRGARVIVLSHFGRPKGPDPELSLRPLVGPLERAIGRPAAFASDCIGPEAEAAAARLGDGEVLLLENLRFHKEEEKNDPGFADRLAALGELYVDDAFSAAHRAHASIVGLAERLPAAAGRLMEAEVRALTAALERPARPVLALVGGAKVSTKLELLGNLVERVDRLALGGGMANTFLAARGVAIGRSLAERDMLEAARRIDTHAKTTGCHLILPVDAVVATALAEGVATRTCPVDGVGADEMILDLGPASVAAILAALDECRTVVWNGPLGAFETEPFDRATTALAEALAKATETRGVLTVAGGGDTDAALARAGVEHRLSYVSTAGGAFLEWLEGKTLPGVAVLMTGAAA